MRIMETKYIYRSGKLGDDNFIKYILVFVIGDYGEKPYGVNDYIYAYIYIENKYGYQI